MSATEVQSARPDAVVLPTHDLLEDPLVSDSLRYCHRVTARRAKNFYYGLRLTPEPRRSALYAVYAFMRACDDLVDQEIESDTIASKQTLPSSNGSPKTRAAAIQNGLARVEQFRAWMLGVLSSQAGDNAWPDMKPPAIEPDLRPPIGAFWPGFRYAVRAYDIPTSYLHAMLDGQRCDLVQTRYHTFNELYDYCYKVASVVGLTCIRVWGAGSTGQAQKMAEYRGIAFQLTNILRDVVEDAQRGRCYLPEDELDRFGVTLQSITDKEASPAFDRFMRFQIERARGYYDMSNGLEVMLDKQCRSTAWALRSIYEGLLNRIAADPGAVLKKRVRLSTGAKVWIGLAATWRQRVGM